MTTGREQPMKIDAPFGEQSACESAIQARGEGIGVGLPVSKGSVRGGRRLGVLQRPSQQIKEAFA